MNRRDRGRRPVGSVAGLSLIELMVALVLGLLLTAGALSIFLSMRAAFRTTEDLSRVQEAGRVAFELMARDVREAGGNQCGTNIRQSMVMSDRDSDFWKNWNKSLIGFGGDAAFATPAQPFGTAAGSRIKGTDGLELHATEDLGIYLVAAMANKDADLSVNAVPADVKDGDALLVCDFRLATLFKATAAGGASIGHGVGAGGNCSAGFSRETSLLCVNEAAMPADRWHLYGNNAIVARPAVVRWYIGGNDDAGKSLYRTVIDSRGAVAASDEVAEGVSQMSIAYLMDGKADYLAAAAIDDWSKVKAARVVLNLESRRKSGVDNQAISRSVSAVLSLRNRNP
ncbi:PilW family protein [Lysobacter enzymogenes]|uniref:PilW family protein n=1 Tax=Lysobacter enzymogenes TaxID=69 RepID=UPI001A968C83|nr:Tfp pilus assembly protein PilW [Lysobacter enzymogenes]QQP98110.1 Tfp pilus assembly protein PilW [Lysobacter enzymogenes]